MTATGGAGSLTFNWGGGITSEDRTGLAVGNYTVTVTDGNSCTATRTFTISQPTALSLLAAATHVTCNSAANGSVNLTVSNGVAPYTFLWSNSATTEDITGLGTGTFTVTVTDANGCTETASAVITQPTALSTTPSVSNVSCFGGNNGSISTTTTGGTTPYSYAWSNGNSTANIASLTAGSYTLTITDANGCSTTTTSNITQPTGAVDVVGSVVSVSCFGSNDGSISLTVTEGVAPYTYNWSNSATTSNINTLVSGSYTVTVTDNNLCTSVKTFTVAQPIAALALTTVKTDISCTGNADGSINLSVSGGTSPYTYNWSTSETVQDISSLDVGTYTVTVTDAKNCTATTSVSITQPTLIVLSSTVTDASCGGGSDGAIDLTVSGGVAPYTYTWSNSAVTEDISAITAGNYNVTVTGANSCSSTLTNIAISEASTIAVTPSVINNNCVNGNQGAINLTVSGGTAPLSYSWSNGVTTKDISGLTAGTYTVVVKDAVNCVKFYGFTITQPSGTPVVLSTAITPSNCTVAAGVIDLTVTGGLAPYTYAWSNSATSQDLSNISAGTYTVTVIDANGCNQVSNNLVNDNASPTLTSTVTNVQCNGSSDGSISLNVSGGVSPYTYTWSNGASTASLTGVGIGTYSVSVVDANGCGTIATNPITEPTVLQLTTAKNDPTCAGSDGEAFATASGGSTPYTYNWSNSATTSSINGLSAATYTVTVTDAHNCTVNSSIVLAAAACAAPIAQNDTFSTTMNTAVTQTVATNDSDPDGLSADLIYSLLTNPTPAQGIISFDPYGAFTFTPATGFTGGFNLTYQVCDLTNICSQAILRIVVTNATNTPTADSDVQTTLEDTPVNIAVIANDNFGSDGPSSSTITITDNANNGTASVNNNGTPNDPTDDSIDYTPTANYYGQDTIIYRICDATGDCDTAIVVMTVTSAPSVGGTTSYAGGVLCSSTNTGTITLSGHTGNVVKWQTSTNGGTTWSDILNTTTSYTFTNAVNNQQYRAVVNNCPACLDALSSVTTITVDLPTITGLSSSNPTLASCPALNDGSITVTASGSNLQYSKDNGSTWQAFNVFSGLTAGSFTIKIRNSVTNCGYTYTSNPVVLSAPTCFEICNDGIDNDGNGLTDCEDTAVCKPVAPTLFKRD